jgi:hypothetical protein
MAAQVLLQTRDQCINLTGKAFYSAFRSREQKVDIRVIQVLLGHAKLDYLPGETMYRDRGELQL